MMMYTDDSRGAKIAKDPAVIRYRGVYLMYYSMRETTEDGTMKWGIGIAQSSNLEQWEKIGELEGEGELEGKGICAPAALVFEGKVHLFYQSYGRFEKDAICHAYSRDGIHFTRNATNPIVRAQGDWNNGRAIDADVCIFRKELFLYFATRDPQGRIQMQGVSKCPLDGRFERDSWRQCCEDTILKPELDWEQECIEAAATIVKEDKVYLFYAGAYNNAPQQIGVAVSSDGIHFTRLVQEPFLKNGEKGSWNWSESGHPYVFEDEDGRIYLFYQGNNDNGKSWYLSKVEIAFRDGMPYILPEETRHYADQVKQGVPNALAYLRHLVDSEHRNPFLAESLRTGFEGIYMELAKLELARRGQKVTWTPYNMEQSLHRVHERLDCDDFVMPAFFFILMRYGDNDVLPQEIMQRLEDEIIGFKYWIDEPGIDIHLPCYFTENHQILYHTIEYLAGQLYPDRVFPSNGQTGAWHKEHATAYLRRWLTWRRRFGFSEWLSSTYYAVDLLALLTLKELCDREEFRRQADQLLSLLLLDMAVHSFQGCFCATSGRMYNAPTMFPYLAATNAAAAYLWGEEAAKRRMLDYGLHADVVVMAVSGYEAPEVIGAVARDDASPIEAFQRMSFNVEDAVRLGVSPADFDNIMLFWSLHTFHHRQVIENSRKFCPWWYNMDAAIAANLEKFQLMERAGAITDQDPNGSALTEVNIYTYRTANYMLSCAQDYRHGRTNFQQHIWQASLGGEAIVFATAPGAGDFTSRPNYFVGNSFMPKATAYKNVLISIHRIPADTTYGLCTHAYFPRHAFEEVTEKNGWIFGRKGEGYVALKSFRQGGSWRPKNPALFQSIFRSEWEKYYQVAEEYEFFVAGHTNIWICELGEPATHGTFAEFVDKVSQSRAQGDTFHFSYDSPSQGHIETGWNEPFTVEGQPIALRGYKRYDNPYCQAEFDTMHYDIHRGEKTLSIDFEEI